MNSDTRSTTNPVKKHQRELTWQIIFPVAASSLAVVLFGVALLVAVAAGAMVGTQVAIIMGIMGTAFITLPLILLCLVPYFVLAVVATFTGRGYGRARSWLARIRDFTARAAVKADELAPKVTGPVTALNLRVTRLEYTLRGLQQPSELIEKERDYE